MTDEMTCRICGGDLASSRHSTRDIHQSLGTCIKTLRTRAEAAEDERDELKNRIGGLDEQVKIQCSDGNWNYAPYMHGMANGLLVAQATMHDLHDFTGLSAPDKWLDSRENAQTARAEAAEDDLRELRENTLLALGVKPADVADDMADGSIRYILGGLLERLAELEAAARWRPVSERPPNDAPVLALLESGEYKVARYVVVGDINGVPLHHWRGTGGTSKHVAYWRPITEEAPPGDMAQKENDEMIDEQEAEQRRLVEIIAELLNDEANTITDRSEKRALIARIAALREFNRWRPVSETPTHDKPVLALLESGEYKVVRYVALGNVNGVLLHHWRGTGGPDKHVAHWRPITEEAPAE